MRESKTRTFKKYLGPVYPFAVFIGLCLAVFTISRLGLSIWQADRVSEHHGWLPILLSGLRIDLTSLSWLFILPAFISCFVPSKGVINKGWWLIARVWMTLGLWFVVYMELATPSFIAEYNLRPNRLFIEYLIYPKEVFSMLWTGYKLELFIGFVGSIISIVGGWKLSRRVTEDLTYPRWYFKPVAGFAVLLIMFMAARSTLGHRAINPAMVAFAPDPLVNDLVLNSPYSMLFAAKNMSSEIDASKYYGKMSEEEIIRRVRESSGMKGEMLNASVPTLSAHTARYQGKPRNVVILLQESLGARFVKTLGGKDLTPNLDKLMTEGWNMTNFYATGTRSVRGIEAVTTGFSPSPSRAVVKLSNSQTGFFSIAELLAKHNYHTQFIYGGEAHFDNMRSFFLGNGFQEIVDLPTFTDPKFVGSWGASDEDLYNEADKQFTKLHKQGQPFFSLVFTTSNHSPFEYPEGRIKETAPTRDNAVRYTDWTMGEFFKKARKSEYWKDTIFWVIADHDARVYEPEMLPVKSFHIPSLVLGGGIQPRQDDRLASSMDVVPTMLSLAGISADIPTVGNDLSGEVPPERQRALMQFDKNFGYMTKDGVVVMQPERPPQGYLFNRVTGKLTPRALSKEEAETARAHSLWANLAYRKGLYHLPGEGMAMAFE
ncbi:LTA synthase family protein [Veronia pacifica]|uniref:Sulfatase N-terminal domain-containing protein n=1 Tax=Veronia pacifica TaxID=1080227 RepID=A0A1C3EK75_9GAMM|nr:LTA synthase family protein [Veronia pacifica]ODA33630.1 hypothetical protein A8L45_09625 [Veronia pacifica]